MKKNKEWSRYLQLAKERPDMFINQGELDIVMDEQTVCDFEAESHKTIGVVYESPYHILVVDLVKNPRNQLFAYERVMPAVQKGAVVAIPVCEGKIVLLNQYRHALRGGQYAFPRGFAEPGLTPTENVIKELREEVNGVVKNTYFLGNVIADSGFEGNQVAVYLCDLSSYSLQYQHEGIQNLAILTLSELQQWIHDGKINDGFTLSALTLWEANRKKYDV